jgi:hypothetical protein
LYGTACSPIRGGRRVVRRLQLEVQSPRHVPVGADDRFVVLFLDDDRRDLLGNR